MCYVPKNRRTWEMEVRGQGTWFTTQGSQCRVRVGHVDDEHCLIRALATVKEHSVELSDVARGGCVGARRRGTQHINFPEVTRVPSPKSQRALGLFLLSSRERVS